MGGPAAVTHGFYEPSLVKWLASWRVGYFKLLFRAAAKERFRFWMSRAYLTLQQWCPFCPTRLFAQAMWRAIHLF